MHVERMKETIRILRNPPARVAFDYGAWIDVTNTTAAGHPCSTYACAGGLMIMHKPFAKEGLSFSIPSGSPTFDGDEGTLALARFLDITPDQSETAFVDLDSYLSGLRGTNVYGSTITANDVADYLQVLLYEELAKTAQLQLALGTPL